MLVPVRHSRSQFARRLTRSPRAPGDVASRPGPPAATRASEALQGVPRGRERDARGAASATASRGRVRSSSGVVAPAGRARVRRSPRRTYRTSQLDTYGTYVHTCRHMDAAAMARQPPSLDAPARHEAAPRATWSSASSRSSTADPRRRPRPRPRALAVGPFARLDANARRRPRRARHAARSRTCSAARRAARPRRWRWRSAPPTDRGARVPRARRPSSARGRGSTRSSPASPRAGRVTGAHGRRYATLWALWLTAVPYGLWSERDRRARASTSTRSRSRGSRRVLRRALDHFGLALRDDVTLTDLARRRRASSRAPG